MRLARGEEGGEERESWAYNEECVDELDGDALAAVFFGERAAPGCEERFAAGVGRQHGRGDFARE